jgi:hypothetical protein
MSEPRNPDDTPTTTDSANNTTDSPATPGSAGTPGTADAPDKDPEDWVTGEEPMTGPQRSYLQTLARQAGEDVPSDLNKAQASELIDRLQDKTGRGGQSGR